MWKEYFSFFPKQRWKDVPTTNAGEKKAKENLNLPASDQQTSTAFTQITTNKPFYGFFCIRGIR